MKKTKLEKLMAIEKYLENRITKINEEKFRIQGILIKHGTFFNAVENALNNGWASNENEKGYWIFRLNLAKDGDADALTLLRAEFKFNPAFKKQTGVFANV